MEEIICDADLHHLGMKDIEARGELLRQEFEMKGIKNFQILIGSVIHWIFLTSINTLQIMLRENLVYKKS